MAPFSANISSPTAPRVESVVANGGPSTVGHSVISDPIMDEALETFGSQQVAAWLFDEFF